MLASRTSDRFVRCWRTRSHEKVALAPVVRLLTVFVIAACACPAFGEERVYARHCTRSDFLQPDMNCKSITDSSSRCEGRESTVDITENTYQQEADGVGPKCYVSTRRKINAPCVPDPALNEPTCSYEARTSVARRHGFAALSHASMAQRIERSPALGREFERELKKCNKEKNFCEYDE